MTYWYTKSRRTIVLMATMDDKRPDPKFKRLSGHVSVACLFATLGVDAS